MTISAAEIESKFKDRLAQQSAVVRRNPIASDPPMPGSCLRRQVLAIRVPDATRITDADVILRLRRGQEIGDSLVRKLGEIGFPVVETELPVRVLHPKTGEVLLTGRIDGRFRVSATERPPFEVKSVNPNSFNRFTSVAALLGDQWGRKYVGQMQLYLHALDEPKGFLILDDCLGHIRALEVEADNALQKELLENLIAINDCLKSGSLPDYASDTTECRTCAFFGRYCMPPTLALTPSAGIEPLEDPELAEMLDRRAELEQKAKEFAELDEAIRQRLRGRNVICGKWAVIGKWRTTTKYEIPEEVKEQFKVVNPEGAWIVEFQKLEE